LQSQGRELDEQMLYMSMHVQIWNLQVEFDWHLTQISDITLQNASLSAGKASTQQCRRCSSLAAISPLRSITGCSEALLALARSPAYS